MRRKIVLEIGDEYYFSEVGGIFKTKIYGIGKSKNKPTGKLQCMNIVDYEVVENKTYSLTEHLKFCFSSLKDFF